MFFASLQSGAAHGIRSDALPRAGNANPPAGVRRGDRIAGVGPGARRDRIPGFAENAPGAPAVRLAETRPRPARHAPWNACATPPSRFRICGRLDARRRFPHRNPARCRIRQRPASRRPALSHCAPWLCKRSSPPGQRGRQRGADAPPLSAPWPAVSPLRAGRRQNAGFSLFRLTYAFRIVIIFLELF